MVQQGTDDTAIVYAEVSKRPKTFQFIMKSTIFICRNNYKFLLSRLGISTMTDAA